MDYPRSLSLHRTLFPIMNAALLKLATSALLTGSISFGFCVSALAETLLEEVIVTAQKREQPLQDVPVAVSVFSGKQIQETGVRDIFDLQVNAPGLTVDANQSATTTNFSIRGIGTGSQNFGMESSVGLYVDGVYRARQSSIINDLVDIGSIEILRGPQGTLFGRNTPSGAILLNTRRPDHEGSGFAEVSGGNYDLASISAAKSFSLIQDVLAVRATAFSTQRDGWMDDISLGENNAVNDRDRFGARLQAHYLLNEDIEILVIADYSEIDEICCGTTVVHDNNEPDQRRVAGGPFSDGSDILLSQRGGTFISDDRVFDKVTAYSHLPISSNKDRGMSIQVDWGLDTATLTSITAWRNFDSFDQIDSDFTDLDALDVTNEAEQSSISQELRIAGLSELFNYVIGLYYFSQDLDNQQTMNTGIDTTAFASVFQELDIAAAETLLGQEAFPMDGFVTNVSQQDHESWALFAQTDFFISETIFATAGLRYTDEEKEMLTRYTQTNAGFGYEFLDALADRPDTPQSISENKVTGTVKLSWNFNEDALFYGSIGTGYKSGGTNTDRINVDRDATFGAEKSTSLEVGMKAEFPDQGVRLNIALHRTDVDDLQVNTFDGDGFNLQNAGTAKTYGSEIELYWQASATAYITLAYAYTIADFDEFEKGNCWLASTFRGVVDPGGDGTLSPKFCRRDGDRIGTNPEEFLALTARKEVAITAALQVFMLGEYTYFGDQVMDSSNDPLEFQDSYTLLNVRLGLILSEYQTEITLWGRNITDTNYYGTAFDAPLQDGKLNAYLRDPATYGLTVRKNF